MSLSTFNSLFEMPVVIIVVHISSWIFLSILYLRCPLVRGVIFAAYSLSILYLRCNHCVFELTHVDVYPFNSLFEMQHEPADQPRRHDECRHFQFSI